ncbi:MAG: hypothetical protein IJ386_07580 [Clostridia bacterium]|nr:hypothetical protein [Clostridia bacterium]
MRENKDRDIIEKIHKIYDVKEPDVLSRLDFSDMDMVPSPEKNLNRRYISAIAVYTAACLVVTASLPFIIGGGVSNPRPSPSMTNVETHSVTGDRSVDSEEVSEYIYDYDAVDTEAESEVADETVTAPETEEPEITVPAETEPEPAESEPEATTTELETTAPAESEPPVTAAPVVTTEKPAEVETDSVANDTDKAETEPEIVDPTPENMVHDKIDIPFTLIRYSGGWSDSLASLLECDRILQEYGYSEEEVRNLGVDQTWPVGDETYLRIIKNKEQFDALAAQITDGLETDLINEGAFAEFAKDFEYFDEAYFEKYDLVFWGFGETVHGIEYKINNFEVDNNAVDGRHNFFVDDEYHDNEFWVNIVKVLPPAGEVIPADVAAENRTTELVLVALEKKDVENVQDEKRVYGTSTVYHGPAPEDGKNMSDIDKFYYQAPYKVDVTEEEAKNIARERLHFAQGSNIYPYTDGDVLLAGELTGMQDYKCELTEWNGFPVYDISFYSMSKSSGTVYRVTLQVYANKRCQKSSIIRCRYDGMTDATAKRVDNYSVTERATDSVAWNTDNSSDNIMYTYYEYADSTSMKLLWEAADLENSKYDVTSGNLVNGLPYLVFDNYKDYIDFISSVYDEYTATGSEAYDFFADSEKYDEEYFENNVLAIVGVKNKDRSVDNRMTVNMYDSVNDENARRISVSITSYIPGFGNGENYDSYVFTEEDEIEYKMYVYEFAREEGVNYEFTHASFFNYDSSETYSYTPYEERQTYYVIKEKNKNK